MIEYNIFQIQGVTLPDSLVIFHSLLLGMAEISFTGFALCILQLTLTL